jgi:hypothetical protein
VLHINALSTYKLMGKETQLHLKVLSPQESGKDNYNGRWTIFINYIEYFHICTVNIGSITVESQ